MIVLCSNGLTSEKLLQRVGSLLHNCKTAALVVTADPDYREKNYHVPHCRAELEALGLTVTICDLDFQPAETLLHFDVVEFIGGNPYYLLDVLHKYHAEPVLQALARERCLIGWSAAAFVFGPTLALVDRYSPEMNTPDLTDLTALGLTDVQVLPHYSRFLARFDGFEDTCRAYEEAHGITVLRLNDGDGVIIQDDEIQLVQA